MGIRYKDLKKYIQNFSSSKKYIIYIMYKCIMYNRSNESFIF